MAVIPWGQFVSLNLVSFKDLESFKIEVGHIRSWSRVNFEVLVDQLQN